MLGSHSWDGTIVLQLSIDLSFSVLVVDFQRKAFYSSMVTLRRGNGNTCIKILRENETMLGSTKNKDSRISILLDELEIEYEVDEDGDFHAVFQLDEKRSQTVYISSATKKIADLEIRKIYSIGYMSDAPLEKKIANLLLGINHSSKLGAWQVMATDKAYYAAYNAQIAADTDAKTLSTVLKAVVESADSIEDYLTGMDVF
ncbi:MAG: hypothetical protein ACI89U_000968 [Gammaproteobacteria bacterium]